MKNVKIYILLLLSSMILVSCATIKTTTHTEKQYLRTENLSQEKYKKIDFNYYFKADDNFLDIRLVINANNVQICKEIERKYYLEKEIKENKIITHDEKRGKLSIFFYELLTGIFGTTAGAILVGIAPTLSDVKETEGVATEQNAAYVIGGALLGLGVIAGVATIIDGFRAKDKIIDLGETHEDSKLVETECGKSPLIFTSVKLKLRQVEKDIGKTNEQGILEISFKELGEEAYSFGTIWGSIDINNQWFELKLPDDIYKHIYAIDSEKRQNLYKKEVKERYNLAIKKNDIQVYEKFLSDFPDSQYSNYVEDKIISLHEESVKEFLKRNKFRDAYFEVRSAEQKYKDNRLTKLKDFIIDKYPLSQIKSEEDALEIFPPYIIHQENIDKVLNNPMSVRGEIIAFNGKIIQIINYKAALVTQYIRGWTENYTQDYYVSIKNPNVSFKDYVDKMGVGIIGKIAGTHTYTTVMGVQKTIPKIEAVWITSEYLKKEF